MRHSRKRENHLCSSSSLAASAQQPVGRMRLPCKRPQSAAVEHHSPTYPRSFQFGANILSFHLEKPVTTWLLLNFPEQACIPHFVCLQRGGIRAFKYKCDLFEVPSWPCRRARSHRRTGCGAITPKPKNWQALTAWINLAIWEQALI